MERGLKAIPRMKGLKVVQKFLHQLPVPLKQF